MSDGRANALPCPPLATPMPLGPEYDPIVATNIHACVYYYAIKFYFRTWRRRINAGNK